MARKLYSLPIVTGLLLVVTGLLLAGCVRVPTGPNVMVLPGSGKGFDEFRADDWSCREFAEYQTGTTPSNAAAGSATSTAALGTVIGAASGAAIGAASGNPATGAAVGAGAGLLGGSILGAESAERSQYSVQRRYDAAYMQCMYAKGNQIPVPRGSQRPATYGPPRTARVSPGEIPPPPRRRPPPPPPDADEY